MVDTPSLVPAETAQPAHVQDGSLTGQPLRLAGILAQVSREALQGEGLAAVMQRIVDCLIRQMPVTLASIIILNEACTHYVQEVFAGELDLALPATLPWPVSLGAAGRCVRSRQSVLIADVDLDPDYIPGNRAVRSEYLAPILHHDRLHGVLNIESTRTDFFSDEVCAAFDAIADQIAGAIHLARVVAELEQANRKLQHLSMSDGLTGIANRRCFDQFFASTWESMQAESRMLALLLVDADCFKPLNDASGHLYGDECLKELARQCALFAAGNDDLVARYGGEELMLVLPDRNLESACAIAEQLRRAVEAAAMPHPASEVAPHITVSIGVSAVIPTSGGAPRLLIATADRAMYLAKTRGRNRVVALPINDPHA